MSRGLIPRALAFGQRNLEHPPSFTAEVGGILRGGREDLWNAVIPAFPDSMQAGREMGAPGSPTPGIVTRQLDGPGKDGPEPEVEP